MKSFDLKDVSIEISNTNLKDQYYGLDDDEILEKISEELKLIGVNLIYEDYDVIDM